MEKPRLNYGNFCKAMKTVINVDNVSHMKDKLHDRINNAKDKYDESADNAYEKFINIIKNSSVNEEHKKHEKFIMNIIVKKYGTVNESLPYRWYYYDKNFSGNSDSIHIDDYIKFEKSYDWRFDSYNNERNEIYCDGMYNKIRGLYFSSKSKISLKKFKKSIGGDGRKLLSKDYTILKKIGKKYDQLIKTIDEVNKSNSKRVLTKTLHDEKTRENFNKVIEPITHGINEKLNVLFLLEGDD